MTRGVFVVSIQCFLVANKFLPLPLIPLDSIQIESNRLIDSLSTMVSPAPLIVPALKKHTATVIWAHGLGDRYQLYTTQPLISRSDLYKWSRMVSHINPTQFCRQCPNVDRSPIAENWRRRGKFEEVKFVFPNVCLPFAKLVAIVRVSNALQAPTIPITVVWYTLKEPGHAQG